MSLVDRCSDCLELVPRCRCPAPDMTLPSDPDEAMGELRGCTVAQDSTMRQRLTERGYA